MSGSNFEKQTGRDVYFQKVDEELKKMIDPETGEIYNDLVVEVKCPLCEDDKYDKLFKKQGFCIVRCSKCGIVFVNPQIKEEKLIKSYTSESEANRSWKDILLSGAQVEFNNNNYSIILDAIEKYQPFGNLLDIGCSFGHFLKLARERGFNVEGLELEDEAIKYGRNELELVIHQKILSEADFKNEKFSVVSALGTLEHVPKPLDFLKNVNQILKPNGVLALTIPNVESLVCMVLKEKSRTFSGRNHLTYFSLRTLSEMLNKAGFEIAWQESYVSGIDSIINEMQFLDPFLDSRVEYLPENFSALLKDADKKKQIEDLICSLGLGYKLRLVAKKI